MHVYIYPFLFHYPQKINHVLYALVMYVSLEMAMYVSLKNDYVKNCEHYCFFNKNCTDFSHWSSD